VSSYSIPIFPFSFFTMLLIVLFAMAIWDYLSICNAIVSEDHLGYCVYISRSSANPCFEQGIIVQGKVWDIPPTVNVLLFHSRHWMERDVCNIDETVRSICLWKVPIFWFWMGFFLVSSVIPLLFDESSWWRIWCIWYICQLQSYTLIPYIVLYHVFFLCDFSY
jgi:hypothetical protein